MNPIHDPDPARDAWLSEALRHAPDAGVAPPREVSDTILRQARAATSSARIAPRRGVLHNVAQLWDWLARPPVAAGFASLMLATLVGVMWWGRPMDEALPRAPAAPTPSPAATPEPRVQADVRAEAGVPPNATVATPERAQPALPEAPKIAPRTRPAAPSPAPTRTAPPVAREAPLQKSEAPPQARSEAAAMAGAGAPTEDAAPQARPVPTATAEAPVAAAAADARTAAPVPERTRSEMASRAAAGAIVQPRVQGKASANAAESQIAQASPEPSAQAQPLAAVRSALAAKPQRWTWQRGAGREEPMNPAVQRWLLRLDAATAPRWREASTPVGGEASDLRLLRDGNLHTTLRIGATSARIEVADAASPSLEADLPEATAAALRAQLERLSP